MQKNSTICNMIRVHKSPQVPTSLINTSNYDGEDVKRQLDDDQHSKCYICERHRVTDFEIEHLKSQTNYPSLVQEWDNLFMGCGYCNRKKSSKFDNILNPVDNNIEDTIEQRLDHKNKRAFFKSDINDAQHNNTIELLNRIYNGTSHIRNIKEEKFFEYTLSIINRFLQLVYLYLESPSSENAKSIRDELAIDKEMLGFKYWIIRDKPALYDVFAQDIIWNKK